MQGIAVRQELDATSFSEKHITAISAKSAPVRLDRWTVAGVMAGLWVQPEAARTARSSPSRKRERSAFVNPLPPPCRNGSAARRSAIRSRVARHLPDVARGQGLAIVFDHLGPRLNAFRSQRDIPGDHNIPLAARSAIHWSATSGPSGTMTVSTMGFATGASHHSRR